MSCSGGVEVCEHARDEIAGAILHGGPFPEAFAAGVGIELLEGVIEALVEPLDAKLILLPEVSGGAYPSRNRRAV